MKVSISTDPEDVKQFLRDLEDELADKVATAKGKRLEKIMMDRQTLNMAMQVIEDWC